VVCPNCHLTFTQAQIDARKQAGEYAGSVDKGDKKAMTVGCIGIVAVILLLATCIGRGDEKGTSAASGSSKPAATGDPKRDAIATYKALLSATAGCDAATATMADVMQSGDLVQAYRAADRAQDACLGTGSEIRAIDVPDSITGENATALEKSLEACDTAYVMKWSGARKLKDIIDGDTSPSALADLQDTTEQMQQGQLLCVGGVIAVATSLGASEQDLGIASGKRK
jgi:hypothetical protein